MTRLFRIVLRSGIGLLVLAAISVALLWWYAAGMPEVPDNMFQTAKVSRGTLELTVSSTGTLAAVETVEVGTEVSGTVETVRVDYNDQVIKGQVLAVLKPDLFNAAVAESQGAVDQAVAGLELAKQDLQRNRPLFEKGYLSDQEFSPYQYNADKTKAALDSARAGLLRSQINFANSVIRSPIAGTVIECSIDAGQTVAASLSTPTLFVIAKDLAQMQIEAQVDETDIGQIRQEQQVRFEVQSYPDSIFAGTVRQIRLQPSTVDNVVTYTVIVDASNESGKLMPGMTATVDFIVHQSENTLLVPVAALKFTPNANRGSNGGSQVFSQQTDGSLRPIQITAGESDGLLTEIASEDLAAGMQVAIGMKQKGEDVEDEGFSLFSFMNQGQGGPMGGGGGSGQRPGGGGGQRP